MGALEMALTQSCNLEETEVDRHHWLPTEKFQHSLRDKLPQVKCAESLNFSSKVDDVCNLQIMEWFMIWYKLI